MTTEPVVGRIKSAITRRSEDLPHPLGPKRATNSPSFTMKLTCPSAGTEDRSLSYTCCTSRISILADRVMDYRVPPRGEAGYNGETDMGKPRSNEAEYLAKALRRKGGGPKLRNN